MGNPTRGLSFLLLFFPRSEKVIYCEFLSGKLTQGGYAFIH